MNHSLLQKSSYQPRLAPGTIIMACCALIFGVCIHLYPYKQLPSPVLAEGRGLQSIHFGNINVYDEAGGCGVAEGSMFSPEVAIVADSSVSHAQEFGGGKIAGEGGGLAPQTEAALIERLSGLESERCVEPALDLSFADFEPPSVREDIIRGRPTIYLPDALYWPYADPPPDTIVVCGVIIQGIYGWSFTLNSVTPPEPRVRAAVVETFNKYLFIAGKGEVHQPYRGVFVDGQVCSEISGGKYAVRI